jgi:cell division septum initiation protein DivIVA
MIHNDFRLWAEGLIDKKNVAEHLDDNFTDIVKHFQELYTENRDLKERLDQLEDAAYFVVPKERISRNPLVRKITY